jgi:hypothetical protein
MHTRTFCVSTAAVLFGLARAAGAQAVGAEFPINTYTTGDQQTPAVAANAAGDFVVVWNSVGQDGDQGGFFGQRFDRKGTRLGSEFQVNSYTTGPQSRASVSMAGDGSFVAAWDSIYGGPPSTGFEPILARRYDASGVAQGADFLVNSITTGNHLSPAVASAPDGSFVVAWEGYGSAAPGDGKANGIMARRFNAAGTPQGSEFLVNSYTTSDQRSPHVASDASGSFVVVWNSYAQDGSGLGIFGQRFDNAGNRLGSEFRVNTYTTGDQARPVVASAPDGSFWVAWESTGQDGSGIGVFAQHFGPTGAPQGGEFQVNTSTSFDQYSPSIASNGYGFLIVTWAENVGGDASGAAVLGRVYTGAGAPLEGPFLVNTYTPSGQNAPSVAAAVNGNFIVAWNSFNQDAHDEGVFGQRYGDLIFRDGFDTGSTGRWSSTVSDGDLGVTLAAALGGPGSGLQAVVNDTNSLYVQDNSPLAENRYRARFYLDPNGFDPGEASSHFRLRVFLAQEDTTNRRLATIVLKRQGGAYSIEGRVRMNDGSRADTGFKPITDAPHSIELDWTRASGPGNHDGSFGMWIDGSLAASLVGLANDASAVGFARLGALSVKGGASGTLYLDQFESRRQNYIGPIGP